MPIVAMTSNVIHVRHSAHVNFHSVTIARDDASRVAAHREKGIAVLWIDSRVSGPFHSTNSIDHAARPDHGCGCRARKVWVLMGR